MITSEKPVQHDLKTTVSLLTSFFVFVVALVSFLLWTMASDGLMWHKILNMGLLFLLSCIAFVTFGGIVVFIGLMSNKSIPQGLLNTSNRFVVYLYPILVYLGRLLGKEKNEIRRSYTHLNNQVLLNSKLKFKSDDILIITPHCLQHTACGIRITHDIRQCKKCGKCSVGHLLHFQEKYGVETHVVTGGTLARLKIKEKKPKMIVAIACERDLISGLMDVKHIPVYAIINDRPEGPCQNTSVDIAAVDYILKKILRGD